MYRYENYKSLMLTLQVAVCHLIGRVDAIQQLVLRQRFSW